MQLVEAGSLFLAPGGRLETSARGSTYGFGGGGLGPPLTWTLNLKKGAIPVQGIAYAKSAE